MNDIKTIYDAIHKKYKDLVNSLTRKEDKSNKVSTVTESNEQYPTAKAVNDKVTELANEVGVDLDKYKEYFTIEATEDGTTVYFRQSDYAVTDGMAPLKVDVSVDNGETWTEVTAAPAGHDAPGAVLATLNAGDKVLIRGNNPAYGYYSMEEGDTVDNCNFCANEPCYIYGNIMSLIKKEEFESLREVNDFAFAFFFNNYDGDLDPFWVRKGKKELLLPATVLGDHCYYFMFAHCHYLVSAPELPATSLAPSCYMYMFMDCTGLTQAPMLPATTLVVNCYADMFSFCSSLSRITCLAIDKDEATDTWLREVSDYGTFIKSPDTTWETGVSGIPEGWTVKDYEDTGNVPVTTAPMNLTEAQKEQVRENIGSDPIIIDLEHFDNQTNISLVTALSYFKVDGKSVSYDEMRNLFDEKRNILLRFKGVTASYRLIESSRYLYSLGVEFIFGTIYSDEEIGFMARIKLAGDASRVELMEF